MSSCIYGAEGCNNLEKECSYSNNEKHKTKSK